MDPPWRKYPEIPAGSIGWRMGPGEDYRWDFYRWFSGLPNEEKAAYMQANPAPEGWRNLYKTIIDKPWQDPEERWASWTPEVSKGWDKWDDD